MDVFNFAKSVEQGIYDVMMWVFFYPFSLLRMVFRPARTLAFVERESRADTEAAFASAMRPALLLFLSIAIGSIVAPFTPEQAKELSQSHIGKLLVDSWFTLLVYRMILFSLFALAGAIFYDLLTPGAVTRETLRIPFQQQCYACAPFALVMSPLLVRMHPGLTATHLGIIAVVLGWFLTVQFLFFRSFLKKNVFACSGLALAVFFTGWAGMMLSGFAIGRL
ncbi:UNVERIFIED_ORG: hypothetical protein LHK14_25310 (plasmid) [Roseateles sp. XES5]|nr:hypothetical protein [Roseateles sp. XES5]